MGTKSSKEELISDGSDLPSKGPSPAFDSQLANEQKIPTRNNEKSNNEELAPEESVLSQKNVLSKEPPPVFEDQRANEPKTSVKIDDKRSKEELVSNGSDLSQENVLSEEPPLVFEDQRANEPKTSVKIDDKRSKEELVSNGSDLSQENVLSEEPPLVFEDQRANEQKTPVRYEKVDRFFHMLEKLGLKDSYPRKMSKRDVLTINSLSLRIHEPTTENELSNLYLYKLMILDYHARYLCVKPQTTTDHLNDCISEEDEDFFDLGNTSIQSVNTKQEHIHPMDIHMAIFHCSNDFLRQYIFTKLSACQFGLPILVPNPCEEEVEFPLWALRHIKKSWKSKNGLTPGKYNSRQMFNTPVPVVSFIRFGSSNYNSKSQILNSVITKQRHSVFYHRHCWGSTSENLLMNGVVEIAWYCPAGREDDIFEDCVAFMNLHGNAAEHPRQLEFLQAVSTVNVLLLSENPMGEAEKEVSQNLSKSHVPLICLFSGKEFIQPSKNPTKLRIAAKKRNQAELTDELTSQIKQCIGSNKQTASIEDCCKAARNQKFKVDEGQEQCQDAHAQAVKLTSLLQEENISDLKERFLPLQGKMWHDWCAKEKEKYRLQKNEKESIEQQLSNISSEMTKIRLSQLKSATPLNEFMQSFLECLSFNSEDMILYRLQWLQILLDHICSCARERLEKDYHSTWKNMNEVPKNEKSQVNQLQSELNSISGKMAASTIGLQHQMREVGQLYEASQIAGKGNEICEQYAFFLPEIGAKTLLYGYPLELMDGDTAHVPLMWIKAVLEKLTETLGEKKLYILSILGLQSSGKSTLLNTMFGVQFSVSAGRCTRGAFMQLIPVESSIKNQLGYDFVLIVDTEGLRSPELSTKLTVSHDNELATFVIGIGDMTVINIMGENASEMHDILQICVQAFLRMKQIKISPSCIFVHQNCAEASAGDKNMEGRRRLLEKLDEIAEMAAKEENIEGVNGFSDVINFDVETQVFYFKNLLEGDPPMAPPNPSYSQNVQELKKKILTIAQWRENHTFSSLFEFQQRIHDLWQALLQENFVFSFRNTTELMVYSSLEEKFEAWSWGLVKYAMERQDELLNQISNDLIENVEHSMLMNDFNEVYNPLQCEIKKYFEEDKNKETLIQWQVNVEKRFESLKTELIDSTLKKCKGSLTFKAKRSELDQKKGKYTEQLTEQSKALASRLQKQHLQEEQVDQEFDKLWKDWKDDVSKMQPKENCSNVKAGVEACLLNKFHKYPNIIQQVQHAETSTEFELKPGEHIKRSLMEKILQKRFVSQFDILKNKLKLKIEAYISARKNDKQDFDEIFLLKIIQLIEEKITEFGKETEIQFTTAFRVDLSVNLCLNYVPMFEDIHEKFKIANDPLTYLESQRDNYLQSFRKYCKGANSVTIFADFFCMHIKPEFLKAVNKKISQQIADELKNNHEAFNGNRSNLENHILRYLADEESFEFFVEYIDSPKESYHRFVKEKVKKICSNETQMNAFLEENVKNLGKIIINASKACVLKVAGAHGSGATWLDNLCKEVGKKIDMKRNGLKGIEKEKIEDWEFFNDVMAKSLNAMMQGVKKIAMEDMETIINDCTDAIKCTGCWEKCPFCKAVCTNTLSTHQSEHSVEFHRPEALSRMHWKGTDQISIDFCTTSVSSNVSFRPGGGSKSVPFKNYREAGDPYNKWNITPDGSMQCYWKWFLCKFQDNWEKKCGYKFHGRGKIPDEWRRITKETALENIK